MRIFGFIISYASVFSLAMVELWGAVPLGFVLKINPWLNGLLASLGAITSVVIIIFGGEGIRRRIVKSKVIRLRASRFGGREAQKSKGKKKKSTLQSIWDKYGVIGLGLLAPWITGAQIGAALGIALKADPKKLFLWLSAGIIICTVILVLLGVGGVSLFTHKANP
jgi:uncharacterized membrane protein